MVVATRAHATAAVAMLGVGVIVIRIAVIDRLEAVGIHQDSFSLIVPVRGLVLMLMLVLALLLLLLSMVVHGCRTAAGDGDVSFFPPLLGLVVFEEVIAHHRAQQQPTCGDQHKPDNRIHCRWCLDLRIHIHGCIHVREGAR